MKKKLFCLLQIIFLLFVTGFLFANPKTIILNRCGYQFYSHTDYLEDSNNWARYAPQNLFDGKLETSWAIGDGGPGTVIYVSIPLDSFTIKIVNGYATNADLFGKNNRVKTIKTELCTAYSFPERATEYGYGFDLDCLGNEKLFILQDNIKPQAINLGLDYWQKAESLIQKSKNKFDKALTEMEDGVEKEGFKKGLIFLYLLRIEIVDVYKGSRWNDTCLSELSFEHETRFIPEKESIVGFWETVRGADYEELDFQDDGYVFAYSCTRPFDSGRWTIVDGVLKIEWDFSNEEVFFFCYGEGTRLTLVSSKKVVVLEEIGFGG